MKRTKSYLFYLLIVLTTLTGAIVSCTKDDEVKVSQVALDNTSKAVTMGESFKLTATITPANAKNKGIIWSSSNPAVAVVGSDGTVAGLSIGTATITVTSEDGSKTATCAVTVATNVISVTSVTLNETSGSKKVGETVTLTATIAPTNATIKTVAWSSSNSDVAIVGSDGKVTALKVGTANIIATADNKTATYALTVIQATNIVTVEGEIKGNRHFVADSVYFLKDFVYVVDGAILTIDAGTVIKGDKPTHGALIIERGGKIMAQGTAQKPIVFTSNQPKGARTYGDWGGIVICGKAKVNPTTAPKVEGGPRTEYGGTNDADNSGVLSYVRIEFGGYPLQPDKEINGLTLCGVGSGTQIDHIQCSYTGDDSFEWFGGTVNCKYLVAFRGLDDEFDTDYGYSGKLQFLLGLRDYRKADVSGSNGFESDNDASGSTNSPITSPTFSNLTLIGPLDTITKSISGDFKRAMHLRRNTKLKVYNSVFAGWPSGLLIDGSLAWTNAQASELQVKNCALVGMKANFEGVSGAAPTAAEIDTWFNDASRANQVISGAGKGPKYAGIFGSFLTTDETKTPTLLPTNSVLLSGADFTGFDGFFTTTTYIGAFGTENWTSGWCNWNPQNTDY